MPYRIYQGKEVITNDALVLPRGQIFVDLNTLDAYVGDGATPGGVPISVTGTGGPTAVDGGSAATVFTPDETLDGGGA